VAGTPSSANEQVASVVRAQMAAANAGPPKRGGTLTAAVQNDWLTFDPILNSADSTAAFQVYDPFFFFLPDESGAWSVQGGLVEKWELAQDAAVFKLRQGVKFHDGSDWNAEVCKWNLDRMMTDPKSLAKGQLNGVDLKTPAIVVDPFTVRLTLLGPQPALLEQLATGYTFPISKAAFEKVGAAEYPRNPVGTGPFKLVEWKSSERVVLKRFDNYWMKGADGQPLPYLDSVTMRLIIDDSVRLVEVKSRTTDIIELVQGKDVPTVKADTGLTYVEANWAGNAYRLIFNYLGGKFQNNLQLRQAALYAIDREAISKALGRGIGQANKYHLLPGSFGYDESVPSYGYDPEKAKALMKEAGLSNGIEVDMLVIAREIDKQQAEMLKQMWERVGIQTRIETLERVAMNQRLGTGGTTGAEFDVTTTRGGNSIGLEDSSLRDHLWSKGSFNKARFNGQGISKEVDAAFIRSASYDPKERAAGYRDVQRLVFDNALYGFLWTQNWNWVLNKRVAGFQPARPSLWDFRRMWLTG
jgi:ABC-type transport system substrate-binding protein